MTRYSNVPGREVTPKSIFQNRRFLLKSMGFLGVSGLIAAGATRQYWIGEASAKSNDPASHLFPAKVNPNFSVIPEGRTMTPKESNYTYNNFYEFGSHKSISGAAQDLKTRPWTLTIDGLVDAPMKLAIDDLFAKVTFEERIYRHRCVEAWSMVIPWTGFPLARILDIAKPKPEAKYLKLETFQDSEMAPGQKQFWYPWPYTEAVTIEEAQNDLAFLCTGCYGEVMPPQHGAPIRLALPWKYGFKSIKSIVRIEFTAERPKSFWEKLAAEEYGFWANVNPAVDHPRWSQASERDLGTGNRIKTLMFNGYEKEVADLYKAHQDLGDKLYM